MADDPGDWVQEPSEPAPATINQTHEDPADWVHEESAQEKPGIFSRLISAAGHKASELAKDVYHQVSLPSEAASGALNVEPSRPGMWSDEDEARLQLTNNEAQRRAFGLGTLINPASRLPVPSLIPSLAKPKVPPPEEPFGITRTAGEKANDLAMRQAEQMAIRSADPHAVEFAAQRAQQMVNAAEGITKGMNPAKEIVAETPQEAGELVSQSLQKQAAKTKSGVNEAYKTAKESPGELHADAFRSIGQAIKNDLSSAENPVIVNKELTPHAATMIDYLDNNVANLKIPNRATQASVATPGSAISGVNLSGVDQWRKYLSSLRKASFDSSPPGFPTADARASQAVLDAFDSHIDRVVNSGMFNGGKETVNAWNNARAAYADYRGKFGPDTPAGKVVQKIIGGGRQDSLTPGKVIDQIVGASRLQPSTLNIQVANRLKGLLGENSPEWIGAKQALTRDLLQAPQGELPFGTAKTSTRLNKFLNSDMSKTMYSPEEQNTLRSYATLMRDITMPPGNYFPSAPGNKGIVDRLTSRVGASVGMALAHKFLPIPVAREAVGAYMGDKIQAALRSGEQRKIARQMPLISQQTKAYVKAKSQSNGTLKQQIAVKSSLEKLNHSLSQIGAEPVQEEGAPARKWGGRVNKKLTHKAVRYVEQSPHKKKHCGNCSMFREGPHCTLVQDPIVAAGYCTRYAKNTKMAKGGAVEQPNTVAEKPETFRLQQDQLVNGLRHVQMFPDGTSPLKLPKGMATLKSGGHVFHYNPKHIKPAHIHAAVRSGRENDILNLGPYSKQDILGRNEHPVAVTERHPDGTEVRAAFGTVATAPHQVAYFEQTKTPGHHIQAENPLVTLGHRMADGGPVVTSESLKRFSPTTSMAVLPEISKIGRRASWDKFEKNVTPSSNVEDVRNKNALETIDALGSAANDIAAKQQRAAQDIEDFFRP